MTAKPTKEQIIDLLKRVQGPDGRGDIVSLGLVSEIIIQNEEKVYFSIAVPPERAKDFEPIRKQAERAAAMAPGVTAVTATLTAEKPGGAATGATPKTGPAGHGRPGRQPLHGIAHIKHIIAVASGKGGVGKSTTAVNLAAAMKANGLRVGILDADIYGPSMPRLLKLTGKPEIINDKQLIPMENYGIKAMSIGLLVDEEKPMIWRGPMATSALTQMMRDVEWGELDIMVVDMPPGTGDVQLTMAQQVPLAGAVIVSTPQDLALVDARKGLNMFRQVDVPVLGIIENMSYFLCPRCGERSEIFSHGGGRAEAERLGAPFLGEIPLDIVIRETSDSGQPIVVAAPESAHAKAYRDIAANIWSNISDASGIRPAPRIIIE